MKWLIVLLVAASLLGAGAGSVFWKNSNADKSLSQTSGEIPLIDRNIPKNLETATFALG